MRQDFGVRVGPKDVATRAEGGSQRTRVFDDAVMDQCERATAVGVRVRVHRRGGAVRGPARVRDARPACGELFAELLLEHAELARRLVNLDPTVLDQREAGRVVTAVLEAA